MKVYVLEYYDNAPFGADAFVIDRIFATMAAAVKAERESGYTAASCISEYEVKE